MSTSAKQKRKLAGLHRGRMLLAGALLSLITWCAVAPAAHAEPQGPWQLPAVDLSSNDEESKEPRIAFAADGTATAVWRQVDSGGDYIVRAATRPPGGAFGTPVDLSATGENAAQPQIVVAPDGTATVAWRRSDGSNDRIQVSTRPTGGSFTPPADISVSGLDALAPRLGVAADGTVTAVWQREAGASYLIQAVTRPPGGSFGPAVDLTTSSQDPSQAEIAVGADGTTTVVWRRDTGLNYRIQAKTRPPGGSFGSLAFISPSGYDSHDPEVAVGGDGSATAVWQQFDGSYFVIQAATQPPGGSFGPEVDLTATGNHASKQTVTAALDGTVTAAWRRNNGADLPLHAAVKPPGGSFGSVMDVSATGATIDDPRITAALDGTVTVVWRSYNGANQVVLAATRPPDGSFGSPVNLSAPGQNAWEPEIAIGPLGEATAVWGRYDGTADVIQSASTEPPSFTLGAAKTGEGAGTVTSAPAGIDCGTDCAESLSAYSKVTLTADPAAGSTFSGWSGDCLGAAGSSCELTMTAARSAVAGFESLPPPSGKARLRIKKFKPKRPRVKPRRVVKIRVVVRNAGKARATRAKLCLKAKGKVKKALRPKGKRCRGLGTLGAGRNKARTFKFKTTRKLRRGKQYKLKFRLSAKGTKAAVRAVRVTAK